MRAALLLMFALNACATTRTEAPREAPRAPRGTPAAALDPALAPAALDGCVLQARTEPLPPFVAPSGGERFRAALQERVADLVCCMSPASQAARVVLVSEPRADGAAASARVHDPAEFTGSPASRACLDRIVASWEIRPAPAGDVCVERPWPHGGCRFAPARVVVPLVLAPHTHANARE